MQWGLGGQAYHVFRRVMRARPWEPMTYHAMARCLADAGQVDLAIPYFELGMTGKWDDRFDDASRIIGMEYVTLLRAVVAGRAKCRLADYARTRLAELQKRFPISRADLVVQVEWTTDGTDVDLHVFEPGGEECYYQHTRTKIGGSISRDATDGYGPEMYVLPKAQPGEYRIRVKFFSKSDDRVTARTRVLVTIVEDWGAPDQKVTRKIVSLKDDKEMHDISTVTRR